MRVRNAASKQWGAAGTASRYRTPRCGRGVDIGPARRENCGAMLGNVRRIRVPGGDSGVEIAVLDFGGRGPAALLHHATGFCAALWAPVAERLGEAASFAGRRGSEFSKGTEKVLQGY